jgi:hypothetical protein
MKLHTIFLTISLACLIGVSNSYAEHQYVGAKKCGSMCHKIKSKGDQWNQWLSTPHAKAFEQLKSEKSLAKAKEMGIADPTTNAKCAKCHITGFEADASLRAKTWAAEDGITCEACHGPGSDYMKPTAMRDREKAIAAGLVIPDKDLCISCHNPENPFHKEFVFETYWPKIAHPRPAKK